MPSFLQLAYSAILVNNTSVDEFKAVSQESWITPIINPTPTTCIAISLGIEVDIFSAILLSVLSAISAYKFCFTR